MGYDWRSYWAGITTLTVADFILLTYDEDPETVERQPDSRRRTTQILNAIESGKLDSSFGYGVPAHRLLRPIPGIKPDQACSEHPANRMLLLSDALKFAVEVGKWEIPQWLHNIYSENTAPVPSFRSLESELAQAKLRIAELEIQLDQLKELSLDLSGKSRTTALKIIGGLIIGAYKMRIHEARLNGLADVMIDLENAGAAVTEKTLSTWIKQAATVIEPPKPFDP